MFFYKVYEPLKWGQGQTTNDWSASSYHELSEYQIWLTLGQTISDIKLTKKFTKQTLLKPLGSNSFVSLPRLKVTGETKTTNVE